MAWRTAAFFYALGLTLFWTSFLLIMLVPFFPVLLRWATGSVVAAGQATTHAHTHAHARTCLHTATSAASARLERWPRRKPHFASLSACLQR
jgi:hypothetical protein